MPAGIIPIEAEPLIGGHEHERVERRPRGPAREQHPAFRNAFRQDFDQMINRWKSSNRRGRNASWAPDVEFHRIATQAVDMRGLRIDAQQQPPIPQRALRKGFAGRIGNDHGRAAAINAGRVEHGNPSLAAVVHQNGIANEGKEAHLTKFARATAFPADRADPRTPLIEPSEPATPLSHYQRSTTESDDSQIGAKFHMRIGTTPNVDRRHRVHLNPAPRPVDRRSILDDLDPRTVPHNRARPRGPRTPPRDGRHEGGRQPASAAGPHGVAGVIA